jgi:hypothetical protein
MDVASAARTVSNGSSGSGPTNESSTRATSAAAGGAGGAADRRGPGAPGSFARLLGSTAGGRGAKGATIEAAGLVKDGPGAPGAPEGGLEWALRVSGQKRGEREGGEEGGEGEASSGVGPSDAKQEDGDGAKAGGGEESEWLDPSARQVAQLAPPGTLGNPVDVTRAQGTEPVRARSLEELLPALVRRIAWAGDRHKGTVRLELGAGAYAGTIVVVHAEGGRVRVELGGSEGPELDRLRARLDARLRGQGLDVESVT